MIPDVKLGRSGRGPDVDRRDVEQPGLLLRGHGLNTSGDALLHDPTPSSVPTVPTATSAPTSILRSRDGAVDIRCPGPTPDRACAAAGRPLEMPDIERRCEEAGEHVPRCGRTPSPRGRCHPGTPSQHRRTHRGAGVVRAHLDGTAIGVGFAVLQFVGTPKPAKP